MEETALRELWEETGALRAEICRVCAYQVNDEVKCGVLFLANIMEIGVLPENFEMAEITFAHSLPENLTYPEIIPELFEKVQAWMNLQSNADELWDVYDEDRNLTGRLHRRGDPLKKGDYHLVIHVWILNSRGEFLLTKRSPNKGFANLWETTGGSALAGDDSLTAAIREVKEETGLRLDPGKGKCIMSSRKRDYFRDVWLFQQDFDLKDVVLQSGETTDKMYANKESIMKIVADGSFVPYNYLDSLFSAAGI